MSTPAWRSLPFDAAGFGRGHYALCRAVPRLDHLLGWLEENTAAVQGDAEVRNWQRAIAGQGWFEIALPGGVRLRSGRAVMLEDKAAFFGVQGRPDLMLAANMPGEGHPLTAVALPRHRIVLPVRAGRWAASAGQAERAVALFEARRPECWADALGDDRPAPLLVTGEGNYAHHIWNQLGALGALLEGGGAFGVAATHQPIAPIADIFADLFAARGGAPARAIPPAALPKLDPLRILPFPAGGRMVMAGARDRIARLAQERAGPEARAFALRMQAAGRRIVWLTLRLQRTATNQMEALAALASALLADGFAVVFDGYSLPHDFAANADYHPSLVRDTVREERALVEAIRARIGAAGAQAAGEATLCVVGWGLLDCLFLAGRSAAYVANHGTLQHKLGYFTKVPGLVHGNPATLQFDRASSHAHVIEDPGVVEYVDDAMVADAPPPGGAAMQEVNDYRFTDIPRLVAEFRAFLRRHGLASA